MADAILLLFIVSGMAFAFVAAGMLANVIGWLIDG